MRLAMVELDGAPRPAVVMKDGGIFDPASRGPRYRDLEEIIEAGPEALREIGAALHSSPQVIYGLRLLCPLRRPQKIMCIGKNYADHAKEMSSALPERPVLFAKYGNALCGPEEEVELPVVSRQMDYEAELAVVIGRKVRQLAPEQALGAVFGYTCANDLTLRDIQQQDGQWTRAKSPDRFCPLGPWLVTADEIPDPQDLGIMLELNGERMQFSSTGRMVFPVAELISYLSRTMTLLPGDLLLTGTPPGVGHGRKPPVYLLPGDVTVVEIEKIGRLVNRVR